VAAVVVPDSGKVVEQALVAMAATVLSSSPTPPQPLLALDLQ
jgi:hypothetical protein